MAIANELSINTAATALDMANAIFGSGVTVQSATFQGDALSSGTYSGALSTIAGISPTNTGVILSTGNVTDFTNSSGTTDTNVAAGTGTNVVDGIDGDAQLNALAGVNTFDAAILNVTFIPDGDYLTIQFVFSSEEYPEYVNGGINDAFGVWVNGVFVPVSVTTAGDVSIDSVNQGSNENLYIDNTADQYNTEMDGFTRVLSFKAPVNSGQVNTIKIAVADGADAIYDSNLLIMGDSGQTFTLAIDDDINVVANSSRTFDILANDVSRSGAALTITQINGIKVVAGQTVTLISGQQVTLNANGTVTVTANGTLGSENLTYTVSDGTNTDVGYITLNTNAAPVLDGIVSGTTGSDWIDASYLGDADGDRIDNNDNAGGTNDDLVYGYGGNDTIFADAGNDTVYGGDGNDVLYSGVGTNILFGNSGNDTIYSASGGDSIYGGTGNDSLYGAAGNDTFFIQQAEGNDRIDAGENSGDNDVLSFYDTTSTLGVSVITNASEAGNYTFPGTTGNGYFREVETIVATAYNDVIDTSAYPSDITVFAMEGNDSVLGSTGTDIFDGGAGDDSLFGGAGNDSLTGGAGNDSLIGGDGNDTINGGDGRDVLTGGLDADQLSGGADADTIYGGAGDVIDGGETTTAGGTDNDVLVVEAGSVITYGGGTNEAGTIALASGGTLTFSNIENLVFAGPVDGTSGADAMSAGYTDLNGDQVDGTDGVNDTIYGYAGNDTISAGSGNDTVFGGVGDDSVLGGSGRDSILGEDGNDTILGGAESDTLDGGAGNDSISGDNGTVGEDGQDLIYGGAGNDTIDGGWNSDTIYGGDGDDLITDGVSGLELIYAGVGNDTVYGGGDSDTVYGGDGRDVLYGGAGGDSLWGENDADTFFGGADDFVTGGEGTSAGGTDNDVLVVEAGSIVTYDGVERGTVALASGGTLTFREIENIVFAGPVDGTAGNDTMGAGYTDLNGDQIDGTDGVNDTIFGYAGNDEIHAGSGNDLVDGGTGNDTLFGDLGNDTILSGTGDDTVSGGDGDDSISNSAGYDVVYGGVGSDIVVGSGMVFGDDGNDIIDFSTSTPLASPNQADGGAGDDTVIGGNATDDVLYLSAGNDSFSGGGNTGYLDWVSARDLTQGASINLATGQATFATNTTTFTGVEAAQGSDFSDTITGDANNNQLIGGAGNDLIVTGNGADSVWGDDDADTIFGGSGDVITGGEGGTDNDTLVLNYADVQSISYGGGNNEAGTVTFTAASGGGTLSFSEIENIQFTGAVDGTSGNDTMGVGYIDAQGDIIDGTDGINDTIYGYGGNDTINAGTGNDAIYGGDGNDTINGGDGADTIFGGAGNDVLDGGNDNDPVYGGAGDDTILSNFSSNVDFTSADIYDGGTGTDTFVIGGTVTDGFDYTIDLTTGLGSYDNTYLNFENVTGGSMADSFTGTSGANILIGNGGNDTLIGGAGDDSLYGGGDRDVIYGGAGDTVQGGETFTTGTDNDTLVLNYADVQSISYGGGNNEAGTVTFTAASGGGTLSFSEIENIVYAGPVDGTAGNDTMGAGYTDLNGDQVDGTDGVNDTIFGYAGDDFILASAGNDTVCGGTGNDTFDGGTGNDSLFGDAGNDMVQSYSGDDSLYGGTGNDYLVVDKASGTIAVAGGENAGDQDSLWLISNSGAGATIGFNADEAGTFSFGDGTASGTFTEIEKVNATNRDDNINAGVTTTDKEIWAEDGNDYVQAGSGNDLIYGGGGNDDLFAGVGADTVYGGTGVDQVYGGDGNDSLDGGDGNDYMQGDAGNDTVVGGIGDDFIRGDAGNDFVYGGVGNDSVYAGAGNDQVFGGDGSDQIFGGFGDDTVYAGAGNDTVTGSGENDIVYGEDGDDYIQGAYGDDTLYGGAGNDTMLGEDDADTFYAGVGDYVDGYENVTTGTDNDVLHVTGPATVVWDTFNPENGVINFIAGGSMSFYNIERVFISGVEVFAPNFVVDGTAGDDLINGVYVDAQGDMVDANDNLAGTNSDVILAGAGNDTVYAAAENDVVDAGDGDDTVNGGFGDDTVYGGAGNDTVDGMDGEDAIYGGTGNDSLFGWAGNDILDGGVGNDMVDGDTGNDLLSGDLGNDTLVGDAGEDTLLGGTGDDQLFGGLDADILDAGDGNDAVFGAEGNDTLIGGEGSDLLLGQADRDVIFGGAGDTVDGGEAGDDYDVLDLTAFGHPATNVIYDTLNPENGTVEFLDGTGAVVGTLSFSNIEQVIACFTPGAMILTITGEVPVEDLRVGDLVLTRDNGYQQICWVGRRDLSLADVLAAPQFNPVKIAAGALGSGLPVRDMLVSPQHRMLIANPRAELLFGDHEVLISAKHLAGLPAVEQVAREGVSYIHFMCKNHEIVRADGAWTESFQPGALSLAGLEDDQRAEILTLFPELSQGDVYPAARMTLQRREAAVLLGG